MHPEPANFKKVFLLAGATIFAALLFLLAYGTYRDDVAKYFRKQRERKMNEEAGRVMTEIEKAYRNDFDGGKTPEETIELFLTALRARDAERASTYYELSVQPKALAGLREEFAKNGNFKSSIQYFTEVREKGDKKCNEKGDGCTFRYPYIYQEDTKVPISGTNDFTLVPKGSSLDEIIDVEINKFTKIWKITQP